MTGIAGFKPGDGDLFIRTVHGFFKVDFHIISQVVTGFGGVGIALSAAAEKILKRETAAAETAAEKLTENILGAAGVVSTAAVSGIGVGIVTELVITAAFLGIAEDFVSLRDLFEFFFSRLVSGVFVRMVFDGKFAVSFFDFVLAGSAFHAKNLIVVSSHYLLTPHCFHCFRCFLQVFLPESELLLKQRPGQGAEVFLRV